MRARGTAGSSSVVAAVAGLSGVSPERAAAELAVLAGGGVSLRATKSIAVRLVQLDYLMTRFVTPHDEHLQNGFRVSTGIIFTFGQR